MFSLYYKDQTKCNIVSIAFFKQTPYLVTNILTKHPY
jgi:hypothetical protein